MRKIFLAGHQGMVGSALYRQLGLDSNSQLITRARQELDLTDQVEVNRFFAAQSFDEIYLAAAKVGGIQANNNYPAEFIYQNLMIQSNVIHAAYESGVTKLLLLGSSCIYPKFAEQPIIEASLLQGELESTNEPYAIAKIAGIKMCESYNRQYGVDYRSVMPTNLYGENDNFHPENSHVIPAMLRRFHQAKLIGDSSVKVWGSGKSQREFLYVDDMADACLHLMRIPIETYRQHTLERQSHVNVGSGIDYSIKQLAQLVKLTVGFQGDIEFDTSKPDGTPRKLLNVTRSQKLGWSAKIDLEQGLKRTYQWFLDNEKNLRGVD